MIRVIKVDDVAFYTSGKVATTTLVSIPNAESCEINDPKDFVKVTMNFVSGAEKVVMLRNPIDRFLSGIFQYFMVEHPLSFVNLKNEMSEEDFNNIFKSQLLNSRYWKKLLERYFEYMDWDNLSGLEEYHYGNWLCDLNLDNSFSYLHFRNLSTFLDSKNIEHTHYNESKTILGRNNEQLVLDIFDQMVYGLDKTKVNVKNLVKPDWEIYKELIKEEYYALRK